MTDTPPDDGFDGLNHKYQRLEAPHTSSTWKVLGEIDAPTGAAVLGHNTATSGKSRGVIGVADSPDDATGVLGKAPEGEADGVIGIANNGGIGVGGATDSTGQPAMLAVNTASSGRAIGIRGETNSTDGYGLATSEDLRLGGALDTAGSDFSVQAGTTATSDAKNVIHGHASNHATSGVVGGVVGGGGYDDGSTSQPNRVTDDYGTVSGGRNNTASGPRATVGGGLNNTADDFNATVAGGRDNTASGRRSTVAGGTNNATSGNKSFVGGGDTNVAGDYNAVVAGGFENTASARATAIGGGAFNEANARRATVAGGADNTANAKYATVGGGETNIVYDEHGTIGGGASNAAGSFDLDTTSATFATVSGGEDNAASEGWATVPGGKENTASGEYSLAAGRAAEANHDGTFVWSDSGSSSFSSTSVDQFLVDAPGGVGIGTDSPRTLFDVDGAVSISKTGVDAYLSSNQPIPDDTQKRVQFDAVQTDDFNDFDTSNGVYTVQTAGDYHIDFLIDWATQFGDGVEIAYGLLINGSVTRGLSPTIEIGAQDNEFDSTDLQVAHCFSKTVFDLSPGDDIEVVVKHTSDFGAEIEGGSSRPTYMTIHKVG